MNVSLHSLQFEFHPVRATSHTYDCEFSKSLIFVGNNNSITLPTFLYYLSLSPSQYLTLYFFLKLSLKAGITAGKVD